MRVHGCECEDGGWGEVGEANVTHVVNDVRVRLTSQPLTAADEAPDQGAHLRGGAVAALDDVSETQGELKETPG